MAATSSGLAALSMGDLLKPADRAPAPHAASSRMDDLALKTAAMRPARFRNAKATKYAAHRIEMGDGQ